MIVIVQQCSNNKELTYNTVLYCTILSHSFAYVMTFTNKLEACNPEVKYTSLVVSVLSHQLQGQRPQGS